MTETPHRTEISLHAYRPEADDLRILLGLAAPVTLVQVGLMSMGAVDTVMVGRVSAVDLAAVAIGNLYFFIMAIFGQGVLYALDPVIAQAVGARDTAGVARGVQRGLIVAVILASVAMLLLVPAGPLLTLARQPSEVVPIADAYANGLILGVIPFYAFAVFRQSLQAMGSVRPIVLTVLAANVLNVGLNWVLIFGNLGAPKLGAVGSAWGTSVSRWFLVFLVGGLAWSQLRPTLHPWRRDSFAWTPLLRFLRVGAPIGGQQFLEFGVFGAAGLLMGLLGTIAVASHQVALQLAAITFMIPVGVAQATSVVVGQAVGRGDPGAGRRAVGAGLMVVTGAMAALDGLLGGTLDHAVYNLGSDRAIRLDAMVAALERALGKSAVIDRQEVPRGDVKRTWADLTRSAADLGYAPSVSFEDGLADFVTWLRRG